MPQIKISAALMVLLSCIGSVAAQDAGPALSIDAGADHHPIDPAIYGMAYPDPALAKEIQLPMNRWGGDATTRYNWRIDRTNVGFDWYFMAGGDGPVAPSGGPDKLIAFAHSCDGNVLLTVPIIDYIDKATNWDSSFPVSLFGRQQSVNPYVHPTIDGQRTDAGNSISASGKQLTLTDDQKLRINILNAPAFEGQWISHLVGKFGPTSRSGTLYELDNEPSGWNNTHRDVHPGQTGDDELVSRSIKYAAAIKSADRTAKIVGPGDFVLHYQGDGIPGDGKKEHGGLGMGDYYLESFAAYQKRRGTRLLDYFDEHYYPLGQAGQSDDTFLEQSRSLWDPTYVEKNWYGQNNGAIDLIPSFHKWVDAEYPGTKISISEYGWGDQTQFITALGETDVLGIFARERLNMACMFGPPKSTEPGANAFRIYRNYDGKGGRFGETWVRSASEDQGKLAVYGALRKADRALTVVIINKTTGDLSSHLALAGFSPGSAAIFRYSKDDPKTIVLEPGPDQPIGKTGFTATYPARSITLLILKPAV
jgi:Glycoside hydrolase family 44